MVLWHPSASWSLPFPPSNSLPDPQNWRINNPSLPFQHLTIEGPKPERNPLIFLLLCCSVPSSSHRHHPSPLPADPNRPPAAAQPSTETRSLASRLKQGRRRNQEKIISKWKQIDPWTRKKKTKINCLLCFWVFCRSPPARKGRRDEAKPDPPVPRFFLRRHVNPCTARGGGAWSRGAATVPAFPEVFLCHS
jgi:Pyruvate/2-oxoacid:ferredoxin oxidoreductase delta subunit